MDNTRGFGRSAVLIIMGLMMATGFGYWLAENKTIINSSEMPSSSPVNNFTVKFPPPDTAEYNQQKKFYFFEDWKMNVEAKAYSCPFKNSNEPGMEAVSETNINSHTYCIYRNGGAAAGTAYEEYRYIGQKFGKLFTISFTLALPNCSNYPESYMSLCAKNQNDLNVDAIVDEVFSTIFLSK